MPFILWKPFKYLLLWWRVEKFLKQQRAVLFEVKMPEEILKPIRAMESVMTSIQQAIYQPPGNWWERWVDGQIQLSVAFEMAAIDGEPHFFVRTHKPFRDAVESAIYSQYPEVEIKEVDDYTKYVPQSLPNKEWDMFGWDYRFLKDDHYPLKTYRKFETEHEPLEEKRVDPLAVLLEASAKIKKGEQLWIQFLAEPLTAEDTLGNPLGKWKKKGEEMRDRLVKRPEIPKQKAMIHEAADVLVLGKLPEEEKQEKEFLPPEMKLTPGEREVVGEIENKMAKPLFVSTIRFIYMGDREVWFKNNFRLGFDYFSSFNTLNMNSIQPNGRTLTKIKKSWFLPLNIVKDRRHYLRCRRLFKRYQARFSPFFPKAGGTFVLNVEEMATMFHFSGRASAPAPGVPRVVSKKGSLPANLPIELEE